MLTQRAVVQATIDIRPQIDPLNSKRNFRLMMSDYVSTVLMPGALRRLQREAPGVTIELLANENEPWQALSRGEIDFLVLPKNFIREGHPAEVLFEDEYVCVCWNENPLVGDSITLEQCLQLGHVVARIGTLRPPTIDAWFFERFGHARHVEVIATNFNSVPHLLVGTNRISIMHRRLALAYCTALPLKIAPGARRKTFRMFLVAALIVGGGVAFGMWRHAAAEAEVNTTSEARRSIAAELDRLADNTKD